MNIHFPPNKIASSEFMIAFPAIASGREISCRISYEALDVFSLSDNHIETFNSNITAIHACAEDLIEKERFTPEGYIYITENDFSD